MPTDPTATNASSGAYGPVQALPASRTASAGSDWRTDPATRIEWGPDCMKDRYGSACGAWSFRQVNHWYRQLHPPYRRRRPHDPRGRRLRRCRGGGAGGACQRMSWSGWARSYACRASAMTARCARDQSASALTRWVRPVPVPVRR